MSAREVSARAICRSRCVNRAHQRDQDSTGACLPEACRLWDVLWGADVDASFAALDAAGLAVVDRSVLIEARDEITAYVKRAYAGSEGYPSMERRMQRDLELARELGRLAAAKGGER